MRSEVYVGFGSNIDPDRNLRAAIEALEALHSPVEVSPVYRNPAVGFAGDDFLNGVVRLHTDVDPGLLEEELSRIETAAGRNRAGAKKAPQAMGPRTLDLDLLLYGSLVEPNLRLPREDILRYAFVLRPLAELAPELVHPVSGQTMCSAWLRIADQSPPMHPHGLMARPADVRHSNHFPGA